MGCVAPGNQTIQVVKVAARDSTSQPLVDSHANTSVILATVCVLEHRQSVCCIGYLAQVPRHSTLVGYCLQSNLFVGFWTRSTLERSKHPRDIFSVSGCADQQSKMAAFRRFIVSACF